MLKIDWRQAAPYQHAKDVPASGLAWEYLRRDDDYCRAYERIKRCKTKSATILEAFSERWGLRFPARPAPAG
ncbi:transcriptional regulator domain-containing protein [Rhodopseudomonas palustris]|uniref:transcriptional regulator domain-containing protein n=1 Tax=Rhodopseudomonas palustris TaxID=1076 RepID=UPI0009B5C2F1